MLREEGADCVVLDLRLPDMSGFELLTNSTDDALMEVPVVVFTGRELFAERRMRNCDRWRAASL